VARRAAGTARSRGRSGRAPGGECAGGTAAAPTASPSARRIGPTVAAKRTRSCSLPGWHASCTVRSGMHEVGGGHWVVGEFLSQRPDDPTTPWAGLHRAQGELATLGRPVASRVRVIGYAGDRAQAQGDGSHAGLGGQRNAGRNRPGGGGPDRG